MLYSAQHRVLHGCGDGDITTVFHGQRGMGMNSSRIAVGMGLQHSVEYCGNGKTFAENTTGVVQQSQMSNYETYSMVNFLKDSIRKMNLCMNK